MGSGTEPTSRQRATSVQGTLVGLNFQLTMKFKDWKNWAANMQKV